ncbi:DUF5009 domain-containing protein [Flavobacterium sp. F-380]|uniref:DUF5009 domain-containing protein n=1 Tax=Flavobacterium kayseriense TaxID=2764714 RepID=A0ABR7JAR7_9FLAO|nr:DUF5009 domain-containing protein [Flavobacterium kayseriense]MBC5842596.1 DUF5009 domain-containing protein [Flavobacterium kayseriense]MBC5849126.1 DUF5009 domain-containing protein [Flavobacterium kayseriense]
MKNERVIAVDVLRGMTVLLMIVVNNPGNWNTVYDPLLHAKWHGCTPTDLVFPTFIFVLGIAIPLALPDKKWDTDTFIKILTRSIRIICLGLFLNFFNKISILSDNEIFLLFIRLLITIIVGYVLLGNFKPQLKLALAMILLAIFLFLAYSNILSFNDVRLPGVLQRIGVVYFFASIIYLTTSIKQQITISICILIGYWALMTFIPVPLLGAANYNEGTNLSSWLDNMILQGHMYTATKTWDPEGILTTLPALATALIGIITSALFLAKEKKYNMLIWAGLLIGTGLLWSIYFPLNKALWTSSYVLYTSGIALLFLTIIHYLIEVKSLKKSFYFFLIWGCNPMIVFFLSGIIPRALGMITVVNPNKKSQNISVLQYCYQQGLVPYFTNEKNASLMYAAIFVVFWSTLLWFFAVKKIFIKV